MMYMRFNFKPDWYDDALIKNIDTEVHLYITFNNSGFSQEFIRLVKTDDSITCYTKSGEDYLISKKDSSIVVDPSTSFVYASIFYGYDASGNSSVVQNTDVVVEWDEDYVYSPEFMDWLSSGSPIIDGEEYYKFNTGRYCWVDNISAVDEGDVPLSFTCDGESYTSFKLVFNNGSNTHSLCYCKDSGADTVSENTVVYDGTNWVDEKYKTFQVTTYTEVSLNDYTPPINLSQYLYMGTLMFIHYSTNGDSDIKLYTSHKSIKYTHSGISGRFTQMVLQKSTNGNYSLLTQMDTSKIYSIYTGSTYSSGYFYYDTTWKCSNSNYYIKSSTNTSVEFSYYNGTNVVDWTANIVLIGDSPATLDDFNRFEFLNSNFADRYISCFAENTLISTKNGDKPVQYITYDDDILVWNFDEGKFDYAKPIFIKKEELSDNYWKVEYENRQINLIGNGNKSHRIFNPKTHLFEYPQDITEAKCKKINKPIKYYNILTKYHFNCFANGLLTSKRYSNMLYPITSEMKFDKSISHTNCCQKYQFPFLSDDEFNALRIAEMEFTEDMRTELYKFWQLKK